MEKRHFKLLTSILCVFVFTIFSLLGFSLNTKIVHAADSSKPIVITRSINVESEKFVKQYYNSVSGILKNSSSKAYNSVKVEIFLKSENESGVSVGKSITKSYNFIANEYQYIHETFYSDEKYVEVSSVKITIDGNTYDALSTDSTSSTGNNASDGVSTFIGWVFIILAIAVFVIIVLPLIAIRKNKLKDLNMKYDDKLHPEVDNADNSKKPKNWICPYCGTANKEEALECKGCGSKRKIKEENSKK